jgi:hypothetical protein
MKHNLNTGSRWRRSLLAIALFLGAFFDLTDNFYAQVLIYIAATYLALTAFFKWCLIYKIFGVDASKENKRRSGMY